MQLVDEVRVLRDGVTAGAPEGRPARLLLAWLALHPGRQPRTLIAADLWPHVHEESARTSLRAALSALRRALGDDADRVLVADRETLGLAPGVQVDRDRPGELAPGLTGEWLVGERDRHRVRSSRGLAAAASALEADGDLPAAAEQARERVARDPYSESAVRELVRLTWLAGDRTGALDVYDRFRERLRSGRGVAPSPETKRLMDELRAGVARPAKLPQVPLPTLVERAAGSPLVGRAEELVAARGAYERVRQGGTGLLLVSGEPGIGKTRLAAELATVTWWEGAAVLAGRVAEDALVPYQAWVEALDGYLAAVPPEAAAALVGRDEQALARILPASARNPLRPRTGSGCSTRSRRCWRRSATAADGADPGRPPLGGAGEPDPARPRAALARPDAPARRGLLPRVGARPRTPAVRRASRSAPRRRRRPRAPRRPRRVRGRGP